MRTAINWYKARFEIFKRKLSLVKIVYSIPESTGVIDHIHPVK